MKNRIVLLIFFLVFAALPSLAEKIPVKITATKIISTYKDDTEVGDWISFITVNDVYVDGKLFIRENTPIAGVVDFVHPNGWLGDSAQITFKTFYAKDIDNKKNTIISPLLLDGRSNEINNWKIFLKNFLACSTRGSEIYIEPDTQVYNIFIER